MLKRNEITIIMVGESVEGKWENEKMRGPLRRMERHRSKQQISDCKYCDGGGNGVGNEQRLQWKETDVMGIKNDRNDKESQVQRKG